MRLNGSPRARKAAPQGPPAMTPAPSASMGRTSAHVARRPPSELERARQARFLWPRGPKPELIAGASRRPPGPRGHPSAKFHAQDALVRLWSGRAGVACPWIGRAAAPLGLPGRRRADERASEQLRFAFTHKSCPKAKRRGLHTPDINAIDPSAPTPNPQARKGGRRLRQGSTLDETDARAGGGHGMMEDRPRRACSSASTSLLPLKPGERRPSRGHGRSRADMACLPCWETRIKCDGESVPPPAQPCAKRR